MGVGVGSTNTMHSGRLASVTQLVIIVTGLGVNNHLSQYESYIYIYIHVANILPFFSSS